MADWCHLPGELLELIAGRLDSFDLIRFRSVCNSWRSSLPPASSPSRFPILPDDGISDPAGGFYLCKRTIFRLLPPETHLSSDWIVKVEEDSPRRMRLLNPLSGAKLTPFPAVCPKTLNLYGLRVLELGHEHVLQYVRTRPFAGAMGDADDLYMEKVALHRNPNGGFVVLTIHVSGKLAFLRSGDGNWTVIDDLPSPYDDVAIFGGRFYAVDSTGRAVVVGVEPAPAVSLVASPVFGGDKKCLVESQGKLLMVDVYLSMGPAIDDDDDEEEEEEEEISYIMSERMVRFKVYELDLSELKWVEVNNLGDRVLFLGDNCVFSAVASDLSGCKKNCIYFMDNSIYTNREEESSLMGSGIIVFSLEDGSFHKSADTQGFQDPFWPPPAWVVSSSPADVLNKGGHGCHVETCLGPKWNMEEYPAWMRISLLFALYFVLKRCVSWIWA